MTDQYDLIVSPITQRHHSLSEKNCKKCRYCQKNDAASKEHIIANRRLKEIQKPKPSEQKNDNIKKHYRGITCQRCNHILGQYEQESKDHLAISTVWKIMAGNSNGVFDQKLPYFLKNSTAGCIEKYERRVLDIINLKKVMPENTFGFDIVYQGVSDSKGKVSINLFMKFELIRVVTESLVVENCNTKEKIHKTIDVIVYVSHDANAHRIGLVLPLICPLKTDWPNTKLKFSHRGFSKIIQDHFPERKITSLHEYYDPARISSVTSR